MRKLSSFVSAIAATFVIVNAETAGAAVLNGSFETNDFTNWETIGQTTVEDSSFGTVPADGNYQAVLETLQDDTNVSSDDLETFLGLTSGSLTSNGAIEGSAIKQIITVNSGDILNFSWNFLTDQEPDPDYNDFAFFTLSSTVNQLADTNSPTNFSFSWLFKETGYQSYTIQQAGTYTLGFGIVDVGDSTVNSALLVDNIRLTSSVTTVPEPSTLIGALTALMFGFVRKRQLIKK